jgi:hypothetical protein
MMPKELRAFLLEAGLSSSDFAKLIEVTPRAVTMWLSRERSIPGPVEAYTRIFRTLPTGIRQREFSRLREAKATMRDGMYAVQYQSVGGGGYATVVFDGGRIYGADPFGGKYDGYYTYDDSTGMALAQVKVTLPPNVPAVFGPAYPFEWSVDISGNMDPRLERGHVQFATPMGPSIDAQYQFLRELPTSPGSG